MTTTMAMMTSSRGTDCLDFITILLTRVCRRFKSFRNLIINSFEFRPLSHQYTCSHHVRISFALTTAFHYSPACLIVRCCNSSIQQLQHDYPSFFFFFHSILGSFRKAPSIKTTNIREDQIGFKFPPKAGQGIGVV